MTRRRELLVVATLSGFLGGVVSKTMSSTVAYAGDSISDSARKMAAALERIAHAMEKR